MKVQVRQGVFETNSSSTHAISIMPFFGNVDWYKNYRVPMHVHFGLSHEFGWEFAEYDDLLAKAAYFWITCCSEYCYLSEKHNLDDIKATVTEWLIEEGVEEVTFAEGAYKEASWKKEDGRSVEDYMYLDFDGYVDHSDIEFAELLLSNKKIFLSYLFDSDSVINTGNDNDDREVEYAAGAKWTFYKGN